MLEKTVLFWIVVFIPYRVLFSFSGKGFCQFKFNLRFADVNKWFQRTCNTFLVWVNMSNQLRNVHSDIYRLKLYPIHMWKKYSDKSMTKLGWWGRGKSCPIEKKIHQDSFFFTMGYMHRSHFALFLEPSLPSFTGVSDDSNEGSVPFCTVVLKLS